MIYKIIFLTILFLITIWYIVDVIIYVANEQKQGIKKGKGGQYLNEIESDFIAEVREKSSF